MNDYMVTLTNGDGEYDKILMEGFNSGNKAALQTEEDYNREGWHQSRVILLIHGSDK